MPSSDDSFDPFGEPVTPGVSPAGESAQADNAARRIGAAVFWTLALLIVAGRIYVSDLPSTQEIAAYAAQVVALR